MNKRWIVAMSLGAVALGLASAAQAGYDKMVVFGDSLSDGGNVYKLTGNTFPPPPYFDGRASNGTTAVEKLAQQWNIALTPSQYGGTNYAYLGSLSGTMTADYPVGSGNSFTTENYDDPQYGFTFLRTGTSVASQVTQFVTSGQSFNAATTLFTVWGGANDFFFDPSANTAQAAVLNIGTSLQQLIVQGGAREILVPNLPDLGKTPLGLSLGTAGADGLTQLSAGFNAGLAATVAQLQLSLGAQIPGLHLYYADVFGAMNALIDSPPAGMNVTDACLVPGTFYCSTDAANYLFWDSVHPTDRGHAFLADVFAQAVPEPSTYALLLAGAVFVLIAARPRGR